MATYYLILGLRDEFLTEDGDKAKLLAKKMGTLYRVIGGCEARQYVAQNRRHDTGLFIGTDGKAHRFRSQA